MIKEHFPQKRIIVMLGKDTCCYLLRLSKKLIPSIISFLIFSLHRPIQNHI